MKNLLYAVLLAAAMVLLSSGQVSAATTADACNVDPTKQPSMQEVNCLLTESALNHDVPPEIVKGIAEKESGNWKHFDKDGHAIVSSDGGIGIMQVTNQKQFDQNRLKNDIAYNIDAGVKVLSDQFKRKDLPVINDKDRGIIEHWYFAVMAYNGIKPVNSPITREGKKNTGAYQEEVMEIVEDYSNINLASLPFQKNDFTYDSSAADNITFNKLAYDVTEPLTPTTQDFGKGDFVETTANTRLRKGASTSTSIVSSLSKGDKLTITGPATYDASKSAKNHYVWYPVKTEDGHRGYVTSSYVTFSFKDVQAGYYAADSIYYLYDRNITKGIPGGEFGVGDEISRWQAAVLLTRANGTKLGNSPDPGFRDVSKSFDYYEEIAAAVDAGLFKGTSATTFEPYKTMTRAEMATVLQRLYQFQDVNKATPFNDVVKGSWYEDSVNALYHAGITNGYGQKDTFAPRATVTRDQFAVFMARSISPDFRLK